MTLRLLGALALGLALAAPASAQAELGATDAQFRSDLETVARVGATVALLHERTGAFPATTFELMGSPEAGETGLRGLPLSRIAVEPAAGGVRVVYNPLPQPYVSDDLFADVTVTRDADGTFTARHALQRRTDPDRGGQALPYDRAGRYRVDRAGGTVCVDPALARAALADGSFERALPDLDGDGVPVEVRTLRGQEVVYSSGGPRADA